MHGHDHSKRYPLELRISSDALERQLLFTVYAYAGGPRFRAQGS